MTINIRKIDIDSLSADETRPPSWAKIDAVVGGIPLKFTLTEEQAARIVAVAEPIVNELVAQLAATMERGPVVVELSKPKESA